MKNHDEDMINELDNLNGCSKSSIPKDNKEMIERVKKCLSLYFDNPDKEYSSFRFDYSDYLTKKPISDREMLSRLYLNIRIYFSDSEKANNSVYASYYANKLRLNLNKKEYRYIDLYDTEFCNWLRDKLGTPYREPNTDEEIIKEFYLIYSNYFFENKDELYALISASKNSADFRKNILSKLDKDIHTGHYGGGCYLLDDCYSSSYNYDLNHLKIEITQSKEYRSQLGRDTLPQDDCSFGDSTIIFKVEGNKVFEEMYKYLGDEVDSKQYNTNLFSTTLSVAYDVGYSEEQINCFMNGSLF